MVLTRSQSSRLKKPNYSEESEPEPEIRPQQNIINFDHQSFPEKLWNIVNSKEIQAVEWRKNGKVIGIDPIEFQYELRTYQLGFKTVQFSSFIRQLHVYGFRKINSETSYLEYEHPNFNKNKSLLWKVTRSRLHENNSGESEASSSSERESSHLTSSSEIVVKKEKSSDDVESEPKTQDSETFSNKEQDNVGIAVPIVTPKRFGSEYINHSYFGKPRNKQPIENRTYWDENFAEDSPADAYFF